MKLLNLIKRKEREEPLSIVKEALSSFNEGKTFIADIRERPDGTLFLKARERRGTLTHVQRVASIAQAYDMNLQIKRKNDIFFYFLHY